MIKTLVTCPVCKIDQHVYAKRICKHVGDGGIQCLGSKTPIKEVRQVTNPALKTGF